MTKRKDWSGNGNSVVKTLGASNHTEDDRELYDYYATDPKAIDVLLKVEQFDGKVWECACGEGHLSKRMTELGCDVFSSDFVDRGFGLGGLDFLGLENQQWGGHIITNPPYIYAQEFVEKALFVMEPGKKLALFLKLLFLEGKSRKEMFRRFPLKTLYVSSSRLGCAKNGIFDKDSSAVAYGWFVWEKGYRGESVIKWVN